MSKKDKQPRPYGGGRNTSHQGRRSEGVPDMGISSGSGPAPTGEEILADCDRIAAQSPKPNTRDGRFGKRRSR